VPVVAAGSIFDGRGLAAALAFGADGVWVGTRFIATPEARSAPGYKDALLRSAEDGTVITRSYSGKPMRALRNAWTDHHEQHPEEVQRFPQQLLASMEAGAFHLGADETATGVDPDREGYPAGQGVGAIDELVPAAELVRRFVADAESAFGRIPSP
jgi:enoyl-[acyl-carrier protein] reductase II